MFQTCFGGGMLDDLNKQLGSVTWFGGAAAKYDKAAFGEGDPPKTVVPDKSLTSFWTAALAPALAKLPSTAPIYDATFMAFIDDAVDKTVQTIARNTGEAISLGDQTKPHHAVLWVGDSRDGFRHFNNIKLVRDALIKQWGEPDGKKVSIAVLFGDGKHQRGEKDDVLPEEWQAQAATEENLGKVLDKLKKDKKITKDGQFVFYAADHGTNSDPLVTAAAAVKVENRTTDSERLELSADLLDAMRADPDNRPSLTVGYSDLVGPVPVFFNSASLGMLDPLQSLMQFLIPEDLLGLLNAIDIPNDSGADFTIHAKEFSTGDVAETLIFVPEPPGYLLSGVACAALWWVRIQGRRRRQPHP